MPGWPSKRWDLTGLEPRLSLLGRDRGWSGDVPVVRLSTTRIRPRLGWTNSLSTRVPGPTAFISNQWSKKPARVDAYEQRTFCRVGGRCSSIATGTGSTCPSYALVGLPGCLGRGKSSSCTRRRQPLATGYVLTRVSLGGDYQPARCSLGKLPDVEVLDDIHRESSAVRSSGGRLCTSARMMRPMAAGAVNRRPACSMRRRARPRARSGAELHGWEIDGSTWRRVDEPAA